MKMTIKLLSAIMIVLFAVAIPASAEGTTETISLYVGQTFELKPYLLSQNALKEGSATWKSYQSEIASVNGSGFVTALKPGETIISATLSSGSSIKEARVRFVVKTAVQSVDLSESSVRVVMGQELVISSKIKTIDGIAAPFLDGVNWKSSDEKIAKVDALGRITGISTGKTVIFAGTKDGDKRANCEVEVYNVVQSVLVEPREATLSIGEGLQLVASITPTDAPIKKVTYKSINTNVVTVTDTGYVTAKGIGETQVFITSLDGAKAAAVMFHVSSMVTGIQLDKTLLELDDINNSYKLSAVLVAKDPSKPPKETGVIWKSLNSNIASVDNNGLVKAIRTGQTGITATSVDGKFAAECSVRSVVQGAANNTLEIGVIKVLEPPKLMYAGQSASVNYSIYPENASGRKVSIKSSPGFTVAPVVSEGRFTMTPTQAGNYLVTVYSGTASTEFTVEVRPSIKNLKVGAPSLAPIGEGYALYLGQKTFVKVSMDLNGITPTELAAKTVKWTYSSADLKVELDPMDPYSASVTLLRPTNTYLEASMLEGSVKHRVSFFYEPMAKAITMAEQADINLNYVFKPTFELTPKENLRYNYTNVINKDCELFIEEAYIDTTFLLSEIEFEKENIPQLKTMADRLSEGTQKSALLDDWSKHIFRNNQLLAMVKQPNAEYQRVISWKSLTDRNLKTLDFFTIKDGGVSSMFVGKVLLRVVSKDGNLEKKMWVTAKAQLENLILMDQNGTIIASSSDLAKQQLLEKEAADKKQQLENIKAKFKITKASELPSEAYLETVLEAIDLKLMDEKTFGGRYQSSTNQLELLTLLVRAYEIETGKTAKKIETRYFSNVKNDVAERAYQLGLIGGNSKRSFNASEPGSSKMIKEAFGKWIKASKTQLKPGVTLDSLLENKTSYSNEVVIQKLLLIMKAKGTGLAFSTILT
jgi:uncharacterized protein YjdB